MDGMLWSLIALHAFFAVIYFLSSFLEKRYPELNLGLVTFGAGILIGSMLLLRLFIRNLIVILLVFSAFNILLGWLITKTKLMQKTRDSLGGYVAGGGTYTTKDGKPTFVMMGPGVGEAIKTPMEIKSRKALHGALSNK